MTQKTTQPPHGERLAALEAVVPGMAGKVDEVHSMVHAINGKLGAFIDQMAKADDRHTKLEVRTRALEDGASSSRGARHVISAVVSAVVALVITYFGGGHYPAK